VLQNIGVFSRRRNQAQPLQERRQVFT
jgi:hypothetical protein